MCKTDTHDAPRPRSTGVVLVPASHTDADALATVFASNVDYFRAAGDVEDDAESVPSTVAHEYLDEELHRRGGRCLLVLDRRREVVGTVAMLVPHPREPCPWIGLLLIDGSRHGEGLGTATAHAVEHLLADEGWTEVRIGVLASNPSALAFWTRRGYAAYDHRDDDRGRRCTLLHRQLAHHPAAP